MVVGRQARYGFGMGEPIAVIQKSSSRPGYVRFDTNRTFTGMGHESYLVGDDVHGDRPPDELARTLFATGQVEEVHVYAQMITIKLTKNGSANGLKDLIVEHYTYYLPGVDVPTAESFG